MPDRVTLERLVRLRSLLLEAQTRATDTTDVGRHNALIQLDGACEYALRLAAFELGLRRQREFHQTFTDVRQAAQGWIPDGWKGVDELHGQRSAVQHQGVLPDAREFSRWSADAQRFVHSLVTAVFGAQLQDIAVSDAVETKEIGEKLRDAELAIESGDYRAAFEHVWAAFSVARGRWASQHRDAVPRRSSRPITSEDLTAADVREQVAIFDDYHDASVFAPDMGEYVWLQSIRRAVKQNLPVNLDEARRAFVFVLGWVLRWEAFSSRYSLTAIRAISHYAQQTPPTSGGHEPRVIASHVEESGMDGRVTVRLQLADVPSGYTATWLRLFEELLRDGLNGLWPERGAVDVGGDGLISLHYVPGDEQVFIELTARVKAAIAATETPYRASVAEWEAWKANAPALTEPYAEALQALQFEGGRLCGEPELDKGGETGTVLLRPIGIADDHGRLNHAFWKELDARGQGQINGSLDLHLGGVLKFRTSKFPPDALASLLADVARAVEAERAAEAAAAAARNDQLQGLGALLDTEFGRVE